MPSRDANGAGAVKMKIGWDGMYSTVLYVRRIDMGRCQVLVSIRAELKPSGMERGKALLSDK